MDGANTDASRERVFCAPYDLVKTMRAFDMGQAASVARFGQDKSSAGAVLSARASG